MRYPTTNRRLTNTKLVKYQTSLVCCKIKEYSFIVSGLISSQANLSPLINACSLGGVEKLIRSMRYAHRGLPLSSLKGGRHRDRRITERLESLAYPPRHGGRIREYCGDSRLHGQRTALVYLRHAAASLRGGLRTLQGALSPEQLEVGCGAATTGSAVAGRVNAPAAYQLHTRTGLISAHTKREVSPVLLWSEHLGEEVNAMSAQGDQSAINALKRGSRRKDTRRR